MSKPVFLWWAHKELWRIIADNPGMSKHVAFHVLRERHPDCIMLKIYPVLYCFACQSARDYCSYISPTSWCQYCPLDWGCKSCTEKGSAFSDWSNAMDMSGNTLFIQTCAEKIADLPLRKNAYELYNIKESPDE